MQSAVAFGAAAGASTIVLLLIALASLGILWLAVRRREIGRRYGGTLSFAAVALALQTLRSRLPVQWDAALHALVLASLLFALVRAAVVTADLLVRRRRAFSSTILRDLLTTVLYGVVVLAIARLVLDVDMRPLFATSALVTAVVGLALQETLGNVFSGLALQIEKPFEPGDWVRVGAHVGRVQGIGWRSTRIVTRSLELVEVPNAALGKEVITNYRGRAVGDELFVGVSYQTPPNWTKEVVLRVLEHHPDVAKTPSPQVWVVDYGDFAVKYRIRFWMVDYGKQEVLRDAIMTSLWYAFRRHGIEIPYPIRTLQLGERRRPGRDAAQRQQERIATLRQVDFLSDLSDEELEVLAPSMHEAAFGRDEIVFREGEVGETFYVLRRGSVEVVARGADGAEVHVADLAAPAFFGEMSLLTGESRTATVRARTDAELLVVEREGFERLFQSRPAVAEEVSRELAERRSALQERREQSRTSESAESRARRLFVKMQSIFRF